MTAYTLKPAPEWADKEPSVNAAAALIRAQRPVKPYTCVHCGTSFVASDARAKFCSNRCQQAAKYQRNKTKSGEMK